MVAAAISRMTYAEYLAFEATSDTRHDHLRGDVFARPTRRSPTARSPRQ